MELIDLVNYYKSNIYPNTYEITSYHGLKLEFKITPEELCHLLFGTINDKMVKNPKNYKGKLGYTNIENKVITLENLPAPIKKYARGRMNYFTEIHKLLSNPKGFVFYNINVEYSCSSIMMKLNIKNYSDIEADFMLCKNINDKDLIYLFLRTAKIKDSIKLIPVSFFSTPINENYLTQKQKEFKVCEVNKKP